MSDQKTILIVDDNQDIRELLAMEFELQNFRVLKADNGKTALEVVRDGSVNVVVSDIRMPGGDGVTLLKELRKRDPFFPGIILITGFADISTPQAFDAGASSIIMKPFKLDALSAAVSKALKPISRQADGAPKGPLMEIRKAWDAFPGDRTKGFSLGHGGFFLECTSPTPGRDTLIAFDLDFGAGPLTHLAGTGTILWSRVNGIWVEINELTEESSRAFDKFVLARRDPAFIPLPS
ncbi:MAG: response regulator [Oligoflexia bacterium]|nr:response regulator [Oligoflexia bacterium]